MDNFLIVNFQYLIGDYRRTVTATGPQASKGTYTPTLDPGNQLPSSAAGT